jgi:hypothetical protein
VDGDGRAGGGTWQVTRLCGPYTRCVPERGYNCVMQ